MSLRKRRRDETKEQLAQKLTARLSTKRARVEEFKTTF